MGVESQPALRFLFEYQGTDVRLISKQQLRMLVPPSDPIEGYEGQSGFWFELRDNAGSTLYRRIVRNPIQHHVEVHSQPDEPMSRRVLENPKGVFTVLVPDLPQADRLALVSSPFTKAYGPARELASFPLKVA
jgi:hypothetical protein